MRRIRGMSYRRTHRACCELAVDGTDRQKDMLPIDLRTVQTEGQIHFEFFFRTTHAPPTKTDLSIKYYYRKEERFLIKLFD